MIAARIPNALVDAPPLWGRVPEVGVEDGYWMAVHRVTTRTLAHLRLQCTRAHRDGGALEDSISDLAHAVALAALLSEDLLTHLDLNPSEALERIHFVMTAFELRPADGEESGEQLDLGMVVRNAMDGQWPAAAADSWRRLLSARPSSTRTPERPSDARGTAQDAAWRSWHRLTEHDLDGVVAATVRKVLDAAWPAGSQRMHQLLDDGKQHVLVTSAHLVHARTEIRPGDAAAIVRAHLHEAASAGNVCTGSETPADLAAAISAQLVAVYDNPLGAIAAIMDAAPMMIADLDNLVPLADAVHEHESTNDLTAQELAVQVPGGPRVLLEALAGPTRDYRVLTLPAVSSTGDDAIALLRRVRNG